MAHDDLGFVADQDHSDLGFEPEADYKGAANAAGEHFANAVSFGYLPQLQAAAEKPMSWILDKITGNHVSDDLPEYAKRRDENIARLKQQEKDHSGASLAGTIAGALDGGIALSPLTPIKGATLASRAMQAGAAGAGIGFLSNPGDTEGEVDPLQLKDRAKDAAVIGPISALLHVGAEGVSNGASWLGNRIKDFAEQKAFKALGPYQRNVLQNSDSINSIGRTALDEGVITKAPTSYESLADRAGAAKEKAGQEIGQIVDELSSKEGVPALSRSEIADKMRSELRAQTGVPGSKAKNARLLKLIQEFEETGKVPTSLPLSADDSALENVKLQYGKPDTQTVYPKVPDPVNPGTFANESKFSNLKDMGEELTQRNARAESANLDRANAAGLSLYSDRIPVQVSTVEKTGLIPNDEIPLKSARDLKQSVNGEIKWDRLPGTDIPLPEQVNRALYHELASGENGIAEQLAAEGKIPNADAFKNAKLKYGNLDEMEKIASKRSDKEFANHFLGLKDAILGSTGAGIGYYAGDKIGGPEGGKAGALMGGLIGGVGSKAAREYGNQILASYGDSLSKLVSASPVLSEAVAKNPSAAASLFQNMLRQNKTPEAPSLDQPESPQILDHFKKNPGLIEAIKNPALKEQIQKSLSKGRNPSSEGYVPEDEAKRSFIQGN